jgi:hypothetical protein
VLLAIREFVVMHHYFPHHWIRPCELGYRIVAEIVIFDLSACAGNQDAVGA